MPYDKLVLATGRRPQALGVSGADLPGVTSIVTLEQAETVKERFELPVVYQTRVSPVIGAHVGPGTVGVCFYPEL